MNKTKLIKALLVVLVSLMLVLPTTSTFAADNTTNFIDVTITNVSSENTNTNTNSNTNTSTNTNTTNSNTNSIANTTNTTTNTNTNSSNYNTNTNLPKTGIAETGSVLCIVFALAVSAVYAFKKLRDYNI